MTIVLLRGSRDNLLGPRGFDSRRQPSRTSLWKVRRRSASAGAQTQVERGMSKIGVQPPNKRLIVTARN